jgi:hypothetical protein
MTHRVTEYVLLIQGNQMASVTRTVRFNQKEAGLIDRFLEKNPFLDFSTLARLAIAHFIENPELKILPVDGKPRSGVRDSGRGGKA